MLDSREIGGAAAGLRHRIVGFSLPSPRRRPFLAGGVLLTGAIVAVLILVTRSAGGGVAPAGEATALPPAVELAPALTRVGVGPGQIGIEAIYGHPALLATLGEAVPPQGVLIFWITENIHEDEFLGPPVDVYLQIDGGERIPPSNSKITADGIHHRTSKASFVLPEPEATALARPGSHRLALVAPIPGDSITSTNRFVWNLPLQLEGVPADFNYAAATEAGKQVIPVAALSDALRRSSKGVSYGGVDGVELTATYATAEYFASAFPAGAADRYMPGDQIVFVISESTHTDSLPDRSPALTLSIAGRDYKPDFIENRVSSPHHRVTIIRYPTAPGIADSTSRMDLLLPDGRSLGWNLPITYARSSTPFGMSWATLLALLAGMLASMWPCLFQLTAYFIPALAGLSMDDARGGVAVRQRFRVLKAALYFVLGFTIVYTAAGALLGFAAGQLGESGVYESVQRWVALAAGVVVLLLALRVAAKVRAPLVCKMPVLSRMSHESRGGARPWEMMLAGLAFATGCMTCFGSALVIAMVVYVGMAQSALYGAMILFIFSLGMGIPLVIAGVAMARVLPLLFRMEKMVRWMGIASALLMVGFGVLLISGNYMAFAEFIYGVTGSPLAG